MPPNRTLPCSLHHPLSLFLHEELDWDIRVYLTYGTHCADPQFTPLKKFQGWMEERLDCSNGESQEGKGRLHFQNTIYLVIKAIVDKLRHYKHIYVCIWISYIFV